ncbi:phosphate ABC transporter membrane protein 1 (PhoT family) [Micromonospora sp. Llam0]|uniref:phosphate ABC transporter permease subunit PstC n=1 Tax=Micromonospora sp. Llam0 TaxID=2485143 RepID=UPI000FA8AF50|nr:phosphate ABC transporter permease subunit PstC [Micromonospora sp. Llam0]ROO51510.1 phosphate ABC transporter membrane protein 1 (PhoT family) [Micromonospora sp. Llam0]
MTDRQMTAFDAAGTRARRLEASSKRYGEKAIKALLAVAAAISVITTTGIVVALVGPTIGFFRDVPIIDFLTGTEWAPRSDRFGVVPLVVGTLNVVLWAMVFAIPIGLGTAIYLSEYARPGFRKVVKPVLEVLAGVPTVAIGFFGVYFLTPLLQDIWPGSFLGGPPGFFMAGAASLCIGLMIVPIVTSISEDAMRAVPAGLREGAYALGSAKVHVATRVVFPAAISGVIASVILGISRALGETMIVLMVAGNNPNMSLNPVESIQAMTAYIGVTASGDVATGTTQYDTLFAVGTLLFVMTLIMNLISIRLVRKFREVYE